MTNVQPPRESGRWWRVSCLAWAAVGFAASVSAAVVHHGLLSSPYRSSFCDISATVSCAQVYLSPLGAVAGVPVAVIGAIWFALALILAVSSLSGSETFQANAPVYLRLITLPAVVVAALLAYVSFAILKTVCLLCVTTDVAVLGVFVSAFGVQGGRATSFVSRVRADAAAVRSRPIAAVTLLLLVVGSVGSVMFFRSESAAMLAADSAPLSSEQRADFEGWLLRQPRVTLDATLLAPANGTPPEAGDSDATGRVEIVKFNDYECPPCGRSFFAYRGVLAKYAREQPGRVRIRLGDFPLDAECNPFVSNGGVHPSACEAAIAVRLAQAQGRGEQMEEWVFSNQAALSPAAVEEAAATVGGVDSYREQYDATRTLVREQVERSRSVGVRTTPTFVVNGIKIEGALPVRYFEALIDYALRQGQR